MNRNIYLRAEDYAGVPLLVKDHLELKPFKNYKLNSVGDADKFVGELLLYINRLEKEMNKQLEAGAITAVFDLTLVNSVKASEAEEIDFDPTCHKCGGATNLLRKEPCPYTEDLGGEYLCNCCDRCRKECREDI